MEFLPIKTPLLKAGDDFANILLRNVELQDKDILVLSSKAVATVEGAAVDLAQITPTPEADELSQACGQEPRMRQAMLDEMKKRNGHIVGRCPHAVLTELKPKELEHGTIMAASAGMDHSNTPKGTMIGWPEDPVASVSRIRRELSEKSGKSIAVMLTDSCCRPRRIGVAAIALTVSGFDPLEDLRGSEDLFGQKLRMTQEARADQLATAANFLMGNANASIPAVIIRDHGLAFSEYEGWVPCLDPEEDIFHGFV